MIDFAQDVERSLASIRAPRPERCGTLVRLVGLRLEARGIMFVGGGEKTYQGMIIGENSRSDDLDVNPLKAKQLTNVRASGKDEAIRLTPPRRMTLEQAIAYIEDDELVEVTPKSIRLRKEVLNPSFRKKRMRED
jgi:GTP-binding protein